MSFPRIERARHGSKKEHIQSFGYAICKIIESLIFIGTLGFYEISLGRWYLFEVMDD